MRKYFTIYEEALSHIWLGTRSLWISLYMRKILFSFISVLRTRVQTRHVQQYANITSLYELQTLFLAFVSWAKGLVSRNEYLFQTLKNTYVLFVCVMMGLKLVQSLLLLWLSKIFMTFFYWLLWNAYWI